MKKIVKFVLEIGDGEFKVNYEADGLSTVELVGLLELTKYALNKDAIITEINDEKTKDKT